MIDEQTICEQRKIFSKLDPNVKFLGPINNKSAFDELFCFWISNVNSFCQRYVNEINLVSFESYSDICLLAHNAIVLTKKSIEFDVFSLDAIYALTGTQPISTRSNYKKHFHFKGERYNTNPLILFAKLIQKKFDFQPISFEKAINYALYCASITLDYNGDLSMVINYLKQLCCITNPLPSLESSKIKNYKNNNELKSLLAHIDFPEDNFQFFIISNFYSTMFSRFDYCDNNIYCRLLFDQYTDLSIDEYIKILYFIPSNPVNVRFNEIGVNKIDFFCFLCFKGSIVLMNDNEFYNSINLDVDPWIYLYYSCFINFDHLFFCNFINKVIESVCEQRWNEIIQFLKSIPSIFITKEDLLKSSLNGNPESALNLLQLNDVFEHLQPKGHIYHEILYIYLNTEMPKFPCNLGNLLVTGTKLYCFIKNDYQANEAELNLLLEKLKTAFYNETNIISQNKTLTYCMCCGSAPFSLKQYENIEFPMVIDDFFNEWSNLQLLNCVLYFLLLLYKRNNIIPEPNIVCNFSCHYLVNENSKGLIRYFSSDEIKQASINCVKVNMFELLKIDNKMRKVCFLILNDLYKKYIDITAEGAFYLIKRNDNFGFDILNYFDEILQYVFREFSYEKQAILIKSLLKSNQFKKFLSYLSKIKNIDQYINLIVDIIKDNLVVDPKISLLIFENINEKEKIIPLLIQEISSMDIEYTSELHEIISVISDYMEEKKFKKKSYTEIMSSSWNNNTRSQSSKTSKLLDLWNINSSYPWKCIHQSSLRGNPFLREQPFFYCYTCGIINQSYCCLPCILTCHKGHDVVYANNSASYCNCYSIPQMCLHNNIQAEMTFNEEDFIRNYILTEHNSIINGFEMLSSILRRRTKNQENISQSINNINIKENQKINIRSSTTLRFYCKLLEFSMNPTIQKLKSFKSQRRIIRNTKIVSNNLVFEQIVENSQFCNSTEAFFKSITPKNLKMLNNKTSYTQINITAVCGYNNNILIVADGNQIVSYFLPSFKKMNCISFRFPILQLIPNHIDQQFFLAVTINQVYIFSVSEDGEITVSNQNLFEVPSDEYIISAYWVPLKPFIVGVLTQTRFQFIDIAENPNHLCLLLSSNIGFYSAEIIDYKNESYVIMSFINGWYSIMKFQTSDVEIRLSTIKKFPWSCKMPYINYSSESSLIFITDCSNDIICFEKDKIIDESFENPIFINTFDFPKDLCFCCTHPQNPNLYIFMHPLSGGIVSIEFAKSKIEISNTGFSFRTIRIPFQKQTRTPLSFFKFENHLYLLTTDGAISEVKIMQPEIQNNNFKVSPLFWAYSKIITRGVNVHVFGIEDNYNSVLFRKSLIIPQQFVPKIIDVSLDSSKLVIVGFRIYINLQNKINLDQEIQIFDRRIPIVSSRYYHIPLEKNEVGTRKHYQIKFNFVPGNDVLYPGNDVVIEEINVFAFSLSNLNVLERKEVSWYDNNSSIFSYDEPEQEPLETFKKVLYKTAKSYIDDDEPIDEKLIKEIIYSLYTNTDYSEISRIILSRIDKNKDNVLKIWVNVIIQVLKKNKIEKSLWKYLLRDIDCLPNSVKTKLKELLWKSNPPLNEPYSLNLAFL